MDSDLTVPEDSKWKEIKDFPTYWVNQYGQVFSMRQRKLVPVNRNMKGYPSVRLFNYGVHYRGVPKLVREAFSKEAA